MHADISWFKTFLAEAVRKKDEYAAAGAAVDAGDLALRLKDWNAAKQFALSGIGASRPKRLQVREMENLLVLRAAERQLGNLAESERLGGEVLRLAATVGFEKPEEFGGRQDLLYFWRLGGGGSR